MLSNKLIAAYSENFARRVHLWTKCMFVNIKEDGTVHIQGVSAGIVNILGGGSVDSFHFFSPSLAL
jgi:hypothetical protein